MKTLSIITINYNNAIGLKKTMLSVLSQTEMDLEYIIVDGASTDGSIDVIREQEKCGSVFTWISESDSGIYNAMNKGLKMASGKYVQFLNSGDTLASNEILMHVLPLLQNTTFSILYGIERQIFPNGKIRLSKELEPTFFTFYRGTIPHSTAYIKRSLFKRYGYYDESLKIVSDWKWYIQAIVLGGEIPHFITIEITDFDKQGISSTNLHIEKTEREKVLQELIPEQILADYKRWAFPISQMQRINKYWLFRKMFYFCERCLFKIEKVFFS